MEFTKVEFTDNKGKEFFLIKNKDKWDFFNDLEKLKTFEITEENYRLVVMEIFELIHGYVGSFGDMESYLVLLKLISKN